MDIDAQTIKGLYKLGWMSQSQLDDYFRSRGHSRQLHVVPSLVNKELRIKVIDDREYQRLLSHRTKYDLLLVSEDGIQKRTKCLPAGLKLNKRLSFLFGVEPRNLNHPDCVGYMLSNWEVHPFVTKMRVSYEFACAVTAVFGAGFGDRVIARCFGPNAYMSTRYSKRPHGSPFTAEEEIQLQEYRNNKQRMDLMAPYTKKKIHELRRNVNNIAKHCNPHCMQLQAKYQIKGIVTGGFRPRPKQKSSWKGLNDHIEDTPWGWSTTPTYGFVNECHVDIRDTGYKKKLREWKQLAIKKKWHYVARLLDSPFWGLATTCGYQFCYRNEEARVGLEVSAFFTLDGLGVAVPIVDGISHHFYGSQFSHRTCLPLCKRRSDGMFSAFNRDDNFSIFAWGSTDNSGQVNEADSENGGDGHGGGGGGGGGHPFGGGGGGGGGGGVVNEFWPAWIAAAYEQDKPQEPYVIPEHELNDNVI